LLLHSESNETCGALSPDGHWLAYASDELGISEIFVQAMPEEGPITGRKWRVSYSGGAWPKWRRDGKELLYLDAERNMVAVDVGTAPTFHQGTPRVLFATGIHTSDARFDVTRDGHRFIIPAETSGDTMPATLILNWTNALRH
jgi:hypothetical protein